MTPLGQHAKDHPGAHRITRDTRGQDLIEYALMGAFVALLSYAGASGLGGSLDNWYGALGDFSREAFASPSPGDGQGSNGAGRGGRGGSNCSDTGAAASGGTCR